MYHISTNKTEESWSRSDIKKAKPSENSDEILERINKLGIDGMDYDTVVDFYKMQLGTWRRFYKEDDNVEVDEAWTLDNRKITRIRSLNIVFYIREKKDGTYKVNSGFVDTINEKYASLFDDIDNAVESLQKA
ncbi:MAG: hypothetical protein K5873_11205 [Treponema sp.]|nr:hypothetical protein [Treponema sp.]